MNSQCYGLYDFRQDHTARKSFGLSLLPAYIHAKKLGQATDFFHQATYLWLFTFPEDCTPGRKPLNQHTKRLLSVVYSKDYEEDPDEDVKHFLWKCLPDDPERILRRDTLANLTLSSHISVGSNSVSSSTLINETILRCLR